MTPKQIKNYCEEAREIAQEEGIRAGLDYLIGEKFSRNLYKLNKFQYQLKFLYQEKNDSGNHPPEYQENAYKLSFALTLGSNYKELLEKICHLEKVHDTFLEEIKETFSVDAIQDYLDTYPRLGIPKKSIFSEEPDALEENQFSADCVISEAEDILLVQEMKKLFR